MRIFPQNFNRYSATLNGSSRAYGVTVEGHATSLHSYSNTIDNISPRPKKNSILITITLDNKTYVSLLSKKTFHVQPLE
jgi:hypothetical protein